MARLLAGAVIASLLAIQATPVLADGCGGIQVPSPQSYIPTGIKFYNDTHYAMRVYWSDFKGNLKEYGLLQPDETAGFKTYSNHRWFVEVYTPDGDYCAGPIAAPDTEQCDMRILFDDNEQLVGMDGGYCDY